jgi:hypothetical protein
VLTDYYHQIENYLTETFGANFIFLIILVTASASIIYFIVISYIITQMDKEYFLPINRRRKKNAIDEEIKNSSSRWFNRGGGYLVKIIIGLFLLVCGIAMLVLPGQGLITMLIGLSMLPFPGKHKIEQNLLARKSIRSSLNWIRIKANKEVFIFD